VVGQLNKTEHVRTCSEMFGDIGSFERGRDFDRLVWGQGELWQVSRINEHFYAAGFLVAF
jgi:hypothetical protein